MFNRCLRGLLCSVIVELAQAGMESCHSESDCAQRENVDDPAEIYRQQRQVVLYDESKLFPHQTNKQRFEFAGEEITILQDWNNVGVAGVVWDAAVILCEYLQDNPQIVQDKKIIELGAGTGLAGMVAALLGGDVVITDRELAMTQLKENVHRNTKGKCESRISIQELDWGISLDKYTTYQVILGADIVYIEDTFPELLKTLRHLSDCSTVLLLSCRIRYDRDEKFITDLKTYFEVKLVHKDRRRDNVIYRCMKIC